jgi:hypothetical protein
MCLIIHSPAGNAFPMDALKDAWKSNPHGAGFAYTDSRGVMQSRKGFMKLKHLEKALRDAPTLETDFTLHFRWATSGKKDAENTHPWIYRDAVAVIHNGVFAHVRPTKTVSDTGVWTHTTVGRLYDAGDDVLNYAINDGLLASNIGAGNKVVLHRAGFRPAIINERAGVWHDGNWFSNTYFGGPFRALRWWTFGDDDASAVCTLQTSQGDRWEDAAMDWYREDAAALLTAFQSGDSQGEAIGEYSLDQLLEYLDDAQTYFPALSVAQVDVIRDAVEWRLWKLLEARERRAAKSKAKAKARGNA